MCRSWQHRLIFTVFNIFILFTGIFLTFTFPSAKNSFLCPDRRLEEYCAPCNNLNGTRAIDISNISCNTTAMEEVDESSSSSTESADNSTMVVHDFLCCCGRSLKHITAAYCATYGVVVGSLDWTKFLLLVGGVSGLIFAFLNFGVVRLGYLTTERYQRFLGM